MKSFNGIALGIVFAALLLSGCTGVNNWWKREHALMPLKEQYWNGELSWSEYRDKKAALIADLERTDYKTPTQHQKALREAIDSHHANRQETSKTAGEDAAIVLKQDEAMIKDSETPPKNQAEVRGMVCAEEATEAPSNAMLREQQEIDYGMLSRSIKANNAPRDTGITLRSAPTADSDEMVTDSKDVKWKKSHDGTIIYTDPNEVALDEQKVQPGQTPPPPAVKEVPVDSAQKSTPAAEPAPAAKHQAPEAVKPEAEAKQEPARAQEEPEVIDFGDL